MDSRPEGETDAFDDLCPLYTALKRIERRYGAEEQIGEGGMKEVLRVYDERTERHVALARPKVGLRPEFYDAFLREAHITARLEHPNIIKLFDMGVDDQQRPFFTMEFKRGLSLRKILSTLRKGQGAADYPYETRLSIFLRVCEAIAYAHSRHVLHLDLKPENIQVGPFGEVQVCDWGMGEIEQGESEEHLSETLLDPDLYGGQLDPAVKGTPDYMAPEQKDPAMPKSAQNDIFALGCLLYELTTLRDVAHCKDQPPKSPAVAAIVRKACAVNLEDRYSTVEAIREDVNRHLGGFSPDAEQSGFIREARLYFRRNRQACLISMCFSLLFFGAGAWFAMELREEYQRTAAALGKTEEALKLARAERANSEKAIARLEREKLYAAALMTYHRESAYEGNLFLLGTMMMDTAISLSAIENVIDELKKSLAANPPKNDPLWSQMGYALFLTQRFAESATYFEIHPRRRNHELRALIHEFAPLVRADGLLTASDFIRLLKQIANTSTGHYELIEKMLIYDSLRRESLIETARIVRAALEIYNPNWTAPEFVFEPEGRHLRIGGRGLRWLIRAKKGFTKRPVPKLCLLRLLEPHSLEIGAGGFGALAQLEGLNLRRLDIRAANVKQLATLPDMNSLRELIIAPGQFTRIELSKLPESIVVKEMTVSATAD